MYLYLSISLSLSIYIYILKQNMLAQVILLPSVYVVALSFSTNSVLK